MTGERTVAVAMVPTVVGGLALSAASVAEVPDAVVATGWALFALGTLALVVAAVQAGRRSGAGFLRSLARGGRTLVGWLVAFLP